MDTRKTLLLGVKQDKDTIDLEVDGKVIEIAYVKTLSGNKCLRIKADENVTIKRNKNALLSTSEEQ